METQRAFAAIAISLFILLGYQYFFVPTPQAPGIAEPINQPAATRQNATSIQAVAPAALQAPQALIERQAPKQVLPGRDITINTSLYKAVISENGAALKSFQLENYREALDKSSPPKELITNNSDTEQPLLFSWGNSLPSNQTIYSADKNSVSTPVSGTAQLTLHSTPPDLEIIRTMTFSDDSYLIKMDVTVKNTSQTPLQGSPNLGMINSPFSPGSDNMYLFTGPALLLNNELAEIKPGDLEDGPQNFAGTLSWLAYEDTYFMTSIIPEKSAQNSIQLALSGKETVNSTVSGPLEIIPVGGEQTYSYNIYFGPKKLNTLQETGHELEKIVNFGWFDIIAKPALYLLNFFYGYFHNYGIAIILVTILFKLVFWPISHKGMKSMKTMQKIQPKMAKLREKFKDDKERLNQEMMTLYKTYKINPLGGCLPMVLQIPVFFALYKVLLQTIELRHSPFIFWINDLSAPDRLFVGLDIPYLGGIPVLTLLMGASMFLQQKMTPTAADPTQAKIMMFLPVIFTFMFLNFASGLVLYWFINNLLSIGQQYVINRSVET
jgi:YidC/Oxa1 family membrane protein insertase